MGLKKNKKQIEEFINKSIEEYNKTHRPKQRKWKKAWEINGTRRPFPALYEALQMYGERIYYPQPKYVDEGYCKWCGKKIENKRRKEFCSDECSKQFGLCTVWNRGRDPYSLRILYRDNFTCQKCGQFLAFKNKLVFMYLQMMEWRYIIFNLYVKVAMIVQKILFHYVKNVIKKSIIKNNGEVIMECKTAYIIICQPAEDTALYYLSRFSKVGTPQYGYLITEAHRYTLSDAQQIAKSLLRNRKIVTYTIKPE